MKGHKILKRVLLGVLALAVVLVAALGIYLGMYNTGNETAKALLQSPSDGVSVEVREDTIAFVPSGEIEAGVVFYPGAKIRADAYTPLADSLAAEGYLCVLVNMPLNLALLDRDAALSVEEQWPDVGRWYVAGHSMGGLAAEQCAFAHPDRFSGLIVIASLIQDDFSDVDLPVLAVYATCDGICTPELVGQSTTPKPKVYTEVTIEGGNHGGFGSYGTQFMDGTATIGWEDQQRQTVDAMLGFLAATS